MRLYHPAAEALLANKKYIPYLLGLILIDLIVPYFEGRIYYFQFMVHDFNYISPVSGRTGAHILAHHLQVVLQPAVLAYVIFEITKGVKFWNTVALLCFLFYTKEVIEVIFWGNNTPLSFIYIEIAAFVGLIIYTFWTKR